MSELRTKLLELAIKAGATIENATKVATDWEQWATEDDPLRLDVPSPERPISERLKLLVSNFNLFPQDSVFILKNKSGEFIEMHGPILSDHDFTGIRKESLSDETWCLDKVGRRGSEDERLAIPDFMAKLDDEPKNPGNQEQEIDWSRPQLVRIPNSMDIFRVISDKGNLFGGVVESTEPDGHFCVGEKVYMNKDFVVYHGEIPQGHPTGEPKTTGLNFLEALKLLTDEKVMIKRASWCEDTWRMYSDGSHLRDEEGDPYCGNSIENFLATDWQIIEP